MTKKLLLALTLSLASVGVAAPTAFACGGYAQPSPEEIAISEVVQAHAERAWRAQTAYVYAVQIQDGGRAVASVHFQRGDTSRVRQVALRMRDGQWRILRVVS